MTRSTQTSILKLIFKRILTVVLDTKTCKTGGFWTLSGMFLAWRNVPTCVTRAWLPETIEMKCFNSWRPTFTFLIFSKSVKIENIVGDFAGLIWKVQNLSNMIMLQELSTTSCRNYFIAWNTKLSRHVYGRLQITKRSHRLKKVKIRCTK